MQFSMMVDVLSLISSIMTIIGIGGFLSWSAFKGGSNRISDTVLSIFVYSLKTVFCLFIGMVTGLLGLLIQELIQFVFLEPLLGGVTGMNYFNSPNYNEAIRNPSTMLSIIMTIGLLLPTYLLLCFSIYTWSLEPLKRFLARFGRKPNIE